jgi:hypothetical protein
MVKLSMVLIAKLYDRHSSNYNLEQLDMPDQYASKDELLGLLLIAKA